MTDPTSKEGGAAKAWWRSPDANARKNTVFAVMVWSGTASFAQAYDKRIFRTKVTSHFGTYIAETG